MVEQQFCKLWVPGSNPGGGSIIFFMSPLNQSEAEIVRSLEKNESRQYTEAAHAEMMRRQMLAYKKAGSRMFWLTVVIAFLALSNLVVGILNYLGR